MYPLVLTGVKIVIFSNHSLFEKYDDSATFHINFGLEMDVDHTPHSESLHTMNSWTIIIYATK